MLTFLTVWVSASSLVTTSSGLWKMAGVEPGKTRLSQSSQGGLSQIELLVMLVRFLVAREDSSSERKTENLGMDFERAFEEVRHNVLIQKLVEMEIYLS